MDSLSTISDEELLTRFVRHGCREPIGRDALDELVRRHIHLVFGTARRITGNEALAEDITQAVFLIFSRKATAIRHAAQLPAWLFQTTRLTAANAQKLTARRIHHEHKAARREEVPVVPEGDSAEAVGPELEEAIAALPRHERDILLLRFFRDKDYATIAADIGISEPTARKRLSRGLERVRQFLTNRRSAPVTAAAVSAILTTAAATRASAALAAAVHASLAGGIAAPLAVTLSKGTLMVMTKLQAAAFAAVVVLVTVPASILVVHFTTSAPPAAPPANPTAVAPAPAAVQFIKPPFEFNESTTRITGPLRPDGTVDYVAAINKRYGDGVSPETNGYIDWLHTISTERAGFDSHLALWRATNGASYLASPDAKREFLTLCGTGLTPAGADRWQDFSTFVVLKSTRRSVPGEEVPPGNPPPDPAHLEIIQAGRSPWAEGDHRDLVQFLKLQDASLQRFQAAVDKPRWWMPAIPADGRNLKTVLWPEISGFSRHGIECTPARAFRARAMLRFNLGDFDAFKRDVFTLKRLARHLAGGPSMFQRQTAAWINCEAAEAIAAVAATGSLAADQIKDLQTALAALAPLPPMSETVDVIERWIALDLAAGISVGAPEITTDESYRHLADTQRDQVDWSLALQHINAVYDDCVKAMTAETLPGVRQSIDAIEKRFCADTNDLKPKDGESRSSYSARVADAIIKASGILRAFPIIEEGSRRSAMEAAMCRVLLDAAEVKARTGNWPVKLTGLPRDIYAQEPGAVLRYDVTPAGVSLSSVGPHVANDEKRHEPINLGAAPANSPRPSDPR